MLDNQELGLEHVSGRSNNRALLLRCWREEEAGPKGNFSWRFVLLHFTDHQIIKGFASLEELLAYLQTELEKGVG